MPPPAPLPRPPRAHLALGALALTLSVVLVGLHLGRRPIAWDELEYVRATRWVASGAAPYRGFWEHHPPLLFYLGAPVARFAAAPSFAGFVRMRVFASLLIALGLALAARVARRAGAPTPWILALAALLLGCPTFAGTLVEYRIDGAMSALALLAVALAESALAHHDRAAARARFVSAGVSLALATLASQRALPVAVAAALVYVVAGRDERWTPRADALWIVAGAALTAAGALGLLALTHTLAGFWRDVIVLGLRYDALLRTHGGAQSAHAYLARLVLARADYGVVALGALFALALASLVARRARPGVPVRLALLALAQCAALVVARVPPYPYHFQLLFVLVALLAACELTPRIARRSPRAALPSLALVAVATTVLAARAVPFAGMRAVRDYQSHVLARVDALTAPGERVFDASGYALGRAPAFRYWMLPHLVTELTREGVLPRLEPDAMARARPVAVVVDARLLRYLHLAPGLEDYLARSYLPLEPAVWVAAPNARLAPLAAARWTVMRSGRYRVVRAPALRGSPWFVAPGAFALIHGVRRDRFRVDTSALPAALSSELELRVDGRAMALPATPDLAAGSTIEARNLSNATEVFLVVPVEHAVFFDVPFPDAALDPMRSL